MSDKYIEVDEGSGASRVISTIPKKDYELNVMGDSSQRGVTVGQLQWIRRFVVDGKLEPK